MTTLATEPQPDPVPDPAGAAPESAPRRLLPLVPPRDPWSWVVTGVVTAVAAILRLADLGRPGHIIFDEVYYAPHAFALWQFGVEWEVPDDGATPIGGAPVLGDSPAYVVHPPLGKWLIALGEAAFGYTPVGWRIATAVAGVVSVLLVVRVARRLFGSTVLGGLAGLFVALDGMHLVMSRTALLDIFLLLFLVAAFAAAVYDRDLRRLRWWEAVAAGRTRPVADRWWQAVPWLRLLTFALLGAALSVKWSAGFFIPVFLLLMVWWEVGARRTAGVARPWRATFARESGGLVAGVLTVPLVYLASWTGWLGTDYGYLRNHPVDVRGEPLSTQVFGSLRNLFDYHLQALSFHSGLDAEHPYQSEPWQWLLLGRPVAFHWGDETACGAERCTSAVLLLGTPLLWWAFLPALGVALWLGIARRDWRVPAVALPAAAGIVPWFIFDDRVMFYFYALPSQPFLVLVLVYVLGAAVHDTANGWRYWLPRVAVGVYVALVVACFFYFYPIYSAQVLEYDAWQARMWLPTWS